MQIHGMHKNTYTDTQRERGTHQKTRVSGLQRFSSVFINARLAVVIPFFGYVWCFDDGVELCR